MGEGEGDIWTALKAKNKLGFIDESLTRPELKEGEGFLAYHAWDMVNSNMCSWILNVIKPRWCPSVAYVDNATTMWQDLQKQYGNASKIYQLKTGIADCRQERLDVVGFYFRLTSLWSELNNHINISYSCKGHTCIAAARIVKMFGKEKAYQFLMGLSEELYEQI